MELDSVDLNLVETFDDACEFMTWLGLRKEVLAVDTETGGLEWWKDDLRLVQFGDEMSGWAIPWERWSGLIQEAFKKYNGPIVMHNAPFDLRYLEKNGCKINRSNVHDTRILGHLIDSTNSTGLKPLGIRYVNNALGALQDDIKGDFARNGWSWATVPYDFGPYWTYGALDTVITANLYSRLKPLAAEFQQAYELESASQMVLMDVMTKGIRIDVPYCERKFEQLTQYVEDMGQYIYKTYKCGVSNREISAALLRDEVLLTERTPTGEWQMTAEILEHIDHPLATDILERRKAQKIASAYFKNLLSKRDGDIIHPDINPLGARTGRMSVSNPAVQQIPRGNIVREAFICREGNKFIDVDFDQVEQRLNAHFTQDEGLIEGFRIADEGGGDFFTNIARILYSDDSIQKSDERRQMTKNVSYAKAYGAQADKIAFMTGLPVDEVIAFINTYERTFPGVKRFAKSVEKIGKERAEQTWAPYVTTAWGRRIYGESEKMYALVNYLIQGTASDILKQKLVDLDSAGLSQYIVLPVHDELLFDVEADVAPEIAEEVTRIMQETERFIVPLTCGAEIGDTWAAVH